MSRYHSLSGAGLAMALLLACSAGAAEPAYEWITDPAQLEARGFAPDGPPIKRLVPDPTARAHELLAERRMQAALKSSGVDVGGETVRWAAVQGADFKFLNEGALYSTTGNFVIHPLVGTPNIFADAPIQLRDDRRIQFLDVWTDDTNAAEEVDVALYRTCHPGFTAGAPDITELAVIEGGTFSGGNRFEDTTVPGAVHVDNPLCTYFVRARFSTGSSGNTVVLQKVRVVWAG
jgi:hypothetical protein